MNSLTHSVVINKPRTLPACFSFRNSNFIRTENISSDTEDGSFPSNNIQITNEVEEEPDNDPVDTEQSPHLIPSIRTSVCDSSLNNERISSSQDFAANDPVSVVSSSDNGLIDNNPHSNTNPEEKPMCRYGKACYRQNPQHKVDFSHPDDNDNEAECTSSTNINANKPYCRYGIRCYRKNKEHLQMFNHSFTSSGRPKRSTIIHAKFHSDSDDSEHLEDFTDTDEYESSFIDDDDDYGDDDTDDSINSDEISVSELSEGSHSSEKKKRKRKKKIKKANKKKKFP